MQVHATFQIFLFLLTENKSITNCWMTLASRLIDEGASSVFVYIASMLQVGKYYSYNLDTQLKHLIFINFNPVLKS